MPLIVTDKAILSAARNAIEVLLRFKGTEVTLTPKRGTVIAKPGGGHDFREPTPRPPQLVALSRIGNDNVGAAETDEQQFVTRNYVLTGRLDMEIAVDDFWSDAEADYRVETVDQTNGYKTSAEVVGFIKVSGVPVDAGLVTQFSFRFPARLGSKPW